MTKKKLFMQVIVWGLFAFMHVCAPIVVLITALNQKLLYLHLFFMTKIFILK